MAVNFERIAERIFEVIRSRGHVIQLYTKVGKRTIDPAEARLFWLNKDNIMVSLAQLGEDSEIKMYISKDKELADIESLLQNLRQVSSFYGIWFNVRKYGEELEPKNFAFLAYKAQEEEKMNESIEIFEQSYPDTEQGVIQFLQREGYDTQNVKIRPDPWVEYVWLVLFPDKEEAYIVYLNEGDMEMVDSYKEAYDKYFKNTMYEAKDISSLSGSSKSSYQKIGNPTKLIVRHSTPVDENKFASRTRNIDKLFLETHEGERLKFPVAYLQGGRAMARHLSEGGEWNDDIGNFIKNTCLEYKNLKTFKRSTDNLNEETNRINNIVRERTQEIALQMRKLQGPVSYKRFVENFKQEENNPLSEDLLEYEIDRLQGLYETELEEDIYASVARLTSNREKADELLNKPNAVSIAEKINTLIEDGDVMFSPFNKERKEFSNKREQYAFEAADLSERVNNNEISDFLAELADKITTKGKLSEEEKQTFKRLRELSQTAIDSSIANEPLQEFIEWATSYVKEDSDEELAKDIADDPALKTKIKKNPKKELKKYIEKE